MSNHTPGPWIQVPLLSGSENDKGFRVLAGDRRDGSIWIADVSPVIDNDHGEASEEGKANARLIAAALDLLAAAKMIMRKLDEYHDQGLDVPAEALDLDAAIAKAQG